jgi:hypothetical protein
MRVISAEHIDEWFFDYFEGNLNAAEKKQLTAFLHSNPLLKTDYDAWKNSYIHEQEIVYPGMGKLLITKPKVSPKQMISLAALFLAAVLSLYWIANNDDDSDPLPKSNEVHRNSVFPAINDSVNKDPHPVYLKKNKPENNVPKTLSLTTDSLRAISIDPENPGDSIAPIQKPLFKVDSIPVQPFKQTIEEIVKDSSELEKEPSKRKKKKSLKTIKLNNSGF